MSDEHDSWFKSAFNLDFDASLNKITAVMEQAKKTAAQVAESIQEVATGEVGAGTASLSLRGSVGRGGKNLQNDVRAVQAALGVSADGQCGPQTIAAIKAFQQNIGQAKPDGRIDPGGGTERALASRAKPAATLDRGDAREGFAELDSENSSLGRRTAEYSSSAGAGAGASAQTVSFGGDPSGEDRSILDRWADIETSVVEGLSSAGDYVEGGAHAVTGVIKDGGEYVGEKAGSLASEIVSIASEEHAGAIGSAVDSGISKAAAIVVAPTELAYSGIAETLRAPAAFDKAVQTTAQGVDTGNMERIIAGAGEVLEHGATIFTALAGPLAGKGTAGLRGAPELKMRTRTLSQIEDLRGRGEISISDSSMDALRKLKKSGSEIELPKGFDIEGQLPELQAATGHEFIVLEKKGKLFLRRGGVDEVSAGGADRVVAHSHPGKGLGGSLPSTDDATALFELDKELQPGVSVAEIEKSVSKIVNEAGDVTYFSHLVDDITGAVEPYLKYIRRKAPK